MINLNKIIKFLPKAEGCLSRTKFGGKQVKEFISQIAEDDKKGAELLTKMLNGAKNPTFEIAAKSKANYTIGAFRLADGKKVLGQGAVSLNNAGTNQSVVKVHVSAGKDVMGANRSLNARAGLGEGQDSIIRGYLDCGKPTNAKDLAVTAQLKDGIIQGNVHVGENINANLLVRESAAKNIRQQVTSIFDENDFTYALNAVDKLGINYAKLARQDGKVIVNLQGKGFNMANTVDEATAVDIANTFGVKGFMEKYVKRTNTLQRSLDEMMTDIRTALRGDARRKFRPCPKVAVKEISYPPMDATLQKKLQNAKKIKISQEDIKKCGK